jgi:hypothetical protein
VHEGILVFKDRRNIREERSKPQWVSFLDADFARLRRICFYWKPPASWPKYFK